MPAVFSGVWRPGFRQQNVLCNWKPETFRAKVEELATTGLYLTSLCSTNDGSAKTWHGIITKSSSAGPRPVFDWDLSIDQFKATNEAQLARGLALSCIDSDTKDGQFQLAGYWASGAPTRFAVGQDLETFRNSLVLAQNKGLVPIDISTCHDGTRRLWSAVFQGTTAAEDFAFFSDGDLEAVIEQARVLGRRAEAGGGVRNLSIVRLKSYRDRDARGVRTKYAVLFRESDQQSVIQPANLSGEEMIAQKQLRQAEQHLSDIDARDGLAATGTRIRVHVRYLVAPSAAERNHIDVQIQNMLRIYEAHEIPVEVVSQSTVAAAGLSTVRLPRGGCPSATFSDDQRLVFSLRDTAIQKGEIVLYCTRQVIEKAGCAAHPNPAEPGAIISMTQSSVWTMAHELGHVLSLLHEERRVRRRSTGEVMFTPTESLGRNGRLPIFTRLDLLDIHAKLVKLHS